MRSPGLEEHVGNPLRKSLHSVSLPEIGQATKGSQPCNVVSKLDSGSGLPALGVNW